MFIFEKYKATKVRVSHYGRYDVEYDDGDTDFGLGIDQIQHFKPFKVGELIEANDGNGIWKESEILVEHNDGTFDVFYGFHTRMRILHVSILRFE